MNQLIILFPIHIIQAILNYSESVVGRTTDNAVCQLIRYLGGIHISLFIN